MRKGIKEVVILLTISDQHTENCLQLCSQYHAVRTAYL